MKERLHIRLKMTPEQYDDTRFQLWIDWCTSKTVNPQSLQKILVCQPLFRWWCKELSKMEASFMDISKDYKDVLCPDTRKALYIESVSPLFKRYSKPLIKIAYDQDPITE
jgi:hypothetical protein